jgi:2-amino-4-hydroxy-6-hydroxymethyldihydropteridine diphosphokinase
MHSSPHPPPSAGDADGEVARRSPLAAAPGQTAYIALGANLGDRLATLREATQRLVAIGTVEATSSVYETDPVGYRDQPPFLNAVVQVRTALPPEDILRRLLAIEAAMGRTRTFRNAPRTLDLDLLLLGDERRAVPGLTLPHPRLQERAFVLAPLAEITPDARVPGFGRTAAELLAALEPAVRAGVRVMEGAALTPKPAPIAKGEGSTNRLPSPAAAGEGAGG